MLLEDEHFIELMQVAFQKFASATIRSYNDEIRFFCKFTNGKNLALVDKFDASGYMSFLQKSVSCHDLKPLAPKTIKRKILTMFSVYNDAYNLDLVGTNPFEKVAKIARELKISYKREPVHLPFHQIEGFLSDAESLRDRAIFAILFGGGLRVSELVQLKLEHVIQLDDGLIGLRVTTAKTGTLRPVKLSKWDSDIVKDYIRYHTKEWLFPNPTQGSLKPLTRKWVSNLCYKTFGYRAHSARHTHISYLLSKGVPIADVARAVGHATITSTMIYDRRILDFKTSVSNEADFFRGIKKNDC
jgi:integrase/recombinase XerC